MHAQSDYKERTYLQKTGLSLLMALALVACSDSEPVVDTLEPEADVPSNSIRLADILSTQGEGQYTLFESGHVRPLAMSDNGQWLFAVNTPAGKLEILEIDDSGISAAAAVQVGLEPVAVAVLNDDEVWVVNHLSDSVSVVRNVGGSWRIVNTLLVGDEPRDIVFAGHEDDKKAYVTTAHRGQNVPYDPELTTPGVGRGDVWVFDASAVGSAPTLGGTADTIINLFSDSPRALATNIEGTVVFAAGFLTGNQTTVIPEETVTQTMGLPQPRTNVVGETQPPASLIVKYEEGEWFDELGRSWSDSVYFTLPDKDVFTIDSSQSPPVLIDAKSISNVGTNLFNMAVHPVTGEIFVTNTDSRNEERFEGSGEFAGHSLRGRFIENRISIIDSAGEVKHRNLNKHINNELPCCDTAQPDIQAKSLAMPTDLIFNGDGSVLYVASTSSSKVGVFDTDALRDDTFVPSEENQIFIKEGGPSGLVLDTDRDRLYVMSRFGNSVSIIDIVSRKVQSIFKLVNPEPEHIVEGRRFLYDANLSSANGDASCGSCHVFGDLDSLAWDLGAPDNAAVINPGPFKLHPEMIGLDVPVDFAALKGPMTTQSLRGMANHGPMHWRGDRTGGNAEISAQPDFGTFNERVAFETFNDAFVGLNGNQEVLSHEEFEKFTDFVLEITYPPNPVRRLDNELTVEQQAAHDMFFNRISDQLFSCNGCHVLDLEGNQEHGVSRPGFFGTDGSYSFEFEPQVMKIPHFRNLYQKVGMFGMEPISKLLTDNADGTNDDYGDQIRGFGFQHDGSVDTIERFISSTLFRFSPADADGNPGNPGGFSGDPEIGMMERNNMESFLLAADSNMAPIVGQQVTLTAHNISDAYTRVELLERRAVVNECDLVANGSDAEYYVYQDGQYLSHDGENYLSNALAQQVIDDKGPVTYTCLPPGSAVSYFTAMTDTSSAETD